MIDLIAALASGAAGAFCMAREDISDSLPGVAISISLVPPLCVVGISLQAGQWDAAGGAFLLFLTNFLSILLAGGGVLALLGLSGAAMVKITGTARRNAFLVIIASVLLVMVPLWITGTRISEDARTEGVTKTVATRWAAGTEYEVRSVNADHDKVVILIIGSGTLPAFTNLESELRSALQRPVSVTLDVVPAEKFASRNKSGAYPRMTLTLLKVAIQFRPEEHATQIGIKGKNDDDFRQTINHVVDRRGGVVGSVPIGHRTCDPGPAINSSATSN